LESRLSNVVSSGVLKGVFDEASAEVLEGMSESEVSCPD
jgi:hypothetical protein